MAHPLLHPTPQSSSVEAHASIANPDGSHSLFVEFKSNVIYRYTVPSDVCRDIDSAPSVGTFVNKMKQTYTGVIVTADEVTKLIEATGFGQVAPKKARKATKKKMLSFFAQYPQLSYFF